MFCYRFDKSQMKNRVNIQSDGINVYVISKVRASNLAKTMLILFNIALIVLYIFFIYEIEKHELKKLLIPAFLLLFVLIFFPFRQLLWNLSGKENIVINAQTITHFYDYGFMKTNRNTIPHQKLTTSYEFVRNHDNEEHGILSFMSYNPKTHAVEEIYETTVLMPKNDLIKIQELISVVLNA